MKGYLRNSGIVSNSKQGASHLSRDNVLTNWEKKIITKKLQRTDMINYLKSFTQVCNSKQEKHSTFLWTFRLQFILDTYGNGQGSMQTNGESNTVNLVRCQQNLSSPTVSSVPFISDKTCISFIDLFPVSIIRTETLIQRIHILFKTEGYKQESFLFTCYP